MNKFKALMVDISAPPDYGNSEYCIKIQHCLDKLRPLIEGIEGLLSNLNEWYVLFSTATTKEIVLIDDLCYLLPNENPKEVKVICDKLIARGYLLRLGGTNIYQNGTNIYRVSKQGFEVLRRIEDNVKIVMSDKG